MEIRSVGSPVVAALNVADRNGVNNSPVVASATSTPKNGELALEKSVDKTGDQTSNIQQLDQAIKDINQSLKNNVQGIEFSVDDDNGKVIVKVVDQNTKELIRQMPTEEALQIAKAMDQAIGLLIKQSA